MSDKSIPGAVITVSDRASAGTYEDRSGPLAVQLLAAHGVHVPAPVIVPDDRDAITAAVRTAVASGVRFVLTTGGTGLGPRDVTVTAVRELCAFEVPGIAEEIRRSSAGAVPAALLSRGIAGVVPAEKPALVVTAPGSTGGVRDSVAVVGPLIAHAVAMLDGGSH